MTEEERAISRRQAVAGAASAAAAGAGAFVLLRRPDDGDAASDSSASVAAADTVEAAPNCVLATEQTEGPYYIDNRLIRSDIRKGKAGVPLLLKLQVLNASTCKPIRGATVEVWHCDAIGDYSGFNAAGTWLRGGQRSNAKGNVTFKTIYPGWSVLKISRHDSGYLGRLAMGVSV